MILSHAIVGVTLGNLFPGFWWFLFLGSIFPDIDHLVLIAKNKLFSLKKIVDSIRFEKKYHISYKTKYIHSIFGALVVSVCVLFISSYGAIYFFCAYLLHLVLDWPDIDDKQYFYPWKKKVHGFLPIGSKIEIIFTLFLLIFMFVSFKL